MKRLQFVLILLLLIAFPVFSQLMDAPVISVLDFNRSGISAAEVEVFVDYLSSYIVETGMFRVIDRSRREAILKELEFSFSDCTDESCQLEIGKLLSASQIIVGSIGKVGERFLLTIKNVDVKTGEALRSSSEKYGSIEELIDDTKRLAYDFVGKETEEKKIVEKSLQSSKDKSDLTRHTALIGGLFDTSDDLLFAASYYFLLTSRLGVTVAAGYGLINKDLYFGAGGMLALVQSFAIGVRAGYLRVWDSDTDDFDSGFCVNASLLFKIRDFAFSIEGGYAKDAGVFLGAYLGMNF